MGRPSYKLETIPVWDGLRGGSECFLCDLAAEAEKDAVSFFLGNSVMNPETRVKVNALGFCPFHFRMLADANKPQGLALLCDTYLQTSRDRLAENFSRLEKAKPGRRTSQAIHALGEETHNRERGCLVCDIIEDRTVRYLYTVVALWNSDTQFREELGQGKGFCLYHFNRLLSMAEMALESDQCNIFVRELAKIEQDNLARIQQDVYWMTQKYKSENRDKPWNGCEDAHKRTVSKIVGSCRSLDPTEKQK